MVEDNPINQQVAIEILESAEVIVEVAVNGRLAVEAVAKSEFEAVLMDIQMPEMDGFEATQLIRQDKKYDELPIIAMTAHAMKGDSDKCFEVGMDDYVTKPINAEQFFSTLAKWIKPVKRVPFVHPRPQEIPPDPMESIFQTNLPGLDSEKGLKRLGGNEKLYTKLLCEFATDFAGAAEKIEAALQQDDLSLANQLVHTLKGVSGNISAVELYQAAVELEKEVKQKHTDRLDSLLTDLRNALNRVLHSVQSLEQNVTVPVREEALSEKSEEMDFSAVTSLINELAELIRKNNPLTEKCLVLLKGHLSSSLFREDLEQLEDHILRFDFRKARKSLLRIAETVGISLSEP
ncbi:response regulator [candidate division CSSED10-310 bacterium]|uniref:Response regulator n=1 Tax=candidate division CSSED10-310 bacterium TaxID=2855610 RepID=A0ABV6Z5P9_UNCC1